jgi:hypothetical protein
VLKDEVVKENQLKKIREKKSIRKMGGKKTQVK